MTAKAFPGDPRTHLERVLRAHGPAGTARVVALTDQNAASVTAWLEDRSIDRTDPAQTRALIAGFVLGAGAVFPPIELLEYGTALLACTVDHRPEGHA